MKHDLKYIYLDNRPDSPRGEQVGILLFMDGDEVDFVKVDGGRWAAEGKFLMPDGTYDMTWAARSIRALIRNGWVDEVAWDERMHPVRVRRSDKPGHHPY